MILQRHPKLNPKRIKDKNLNTDNYFGQEVLVPANNGYVAISLAIALILNFLPLQDDLLILRPDFVAITVAYWSINHPHKMGMSVAFGMGLLMDVGSTSILGQHALAYCVTVYLTLVFGRRLRLFSLIQQAPQIGLILFMMQIVIVLIAISNDSNLPGWQYFLASVTGALLWVPASFLLSIPLKQKPDPDAL